MPVTDANDRGVQPLVYSPAQAATALGCTRQTIYMLIGAGQLRRMKVGRLTRIPISDVHAMAGVTGAEYAPTPGGGARGSTS